MDIGDLILEGAKNSVEAGADSLWITVSLYGGEAEITIDDNGTSDIPDDPFSPGISSKGPGRGFGLYHVHAFDSNASLVRHEGGARLSFCGAYDGSLLHLDEVLLPVFMLKGWKSFLFKKGMKSMCIEQEGIPGSIGAVASFRAMVMEKEFEMSKLTLDDLHKIREKEQEKLKKRDIHGKDVHIVVAMGTSGIAAGAKVVLNTIADELEKAGCDDVILTQCGSEDGYPEPFVEVYSKEKGLTAYGAVSKSDAVRIVREHILNGNILSDKAVQVKEE